MSQERVVELSLIILVNKNQEQWEMKKEDTEQRWQHEIGDQ